MKALVLWIPLLLATIAAAECGEVLGRFGLDAAFDDFLFWLVWLAVGGAAALRVMEVPRARRYVMAVWFFAAGPKSRYLRLDRKRVVALVGAGLAGWLALVAAISACMS